MGEAALFHKQLRLDWLTGVFFFGVVLTSQAPLNSLASCVGSWESDRDEYEAMQDQMEEQGDHPRASNKVRGKKLDAFSNASDVLAWVEKGHYVDVKSIKPGSHKFGVTKPDLVIWREGDHSEDSPHALLIARSLRTINSDGLLDPDHAIPIKNFLRKSDRSFEHHHLSGEEVGFAVLVLGDMPRFKFLPEDVVQRLGEEKHAEYVASLSDYNDAMKDYEKWASPESLTRLKEQLKRLLDFKGDLLKSLRHTRGVAIWVRDPKKLGFIPVIEFFQDDQGKWNERKGIEIRGLPYLWQAIETNAA